MQAASHVPVAIRCERSYVFSMVGRESGDRITFKINVVCRMVENIVKHFCEVEKFSYLYIYLFLFLFITIFLQFYYF